MLYLILAIIASTLIIVTFRIFDRFKIQKLPAITINYLTASLLGYLSLLPDLDISSIPTKPWFEISIVVGATLIIAFNFFALSAQKAGVATTAIASRMSVILPVSLGFLLFHDEINALKIIGIFAGLFAFFLVFKQEKKVAFRRKNLLLPLLLLFTVGINDSMLKISQHYFIADDFILFLATAFLVALFIGFTISLLSNQKFIFNFNHRNIVAGVLLGIFNWYSTYYFLIGMDTIPVSVIVPIFNISVVALSTLTGYFVFKERINTYNWVGVLLAFISILLIAIA